MQTKHTPGPWAAFSHPSHGYYIYPSKEGNTPIRDSFAVVNFADTSRGYTSGEAKANARLIAAAPELLEALQRCEDALAALFDQGAVSESFMAGCTTLGNTRIHTLAAIAKATGSAE